MACFLVPTTEAIVTTVIKKAADKKAAPAKKAAPKKKAEPKKE